MSRHEGVSCDSCLKGNFRGRRYKCLICYDYDLCAACYEAGATTTRHTTEHPMQCILTRADFELYYGGEALTSVEQPQAYTCPYCNRMGFTDQTLQEHVTNEHSDISFEVVCPVCASVPGGDPNLMTDDFAGHLTLEHRSGPRDLISFLDEPVSTRHNVRRIPHTSRGVTGSRSRRSNMHFSTLSNTTTNMFSFGQGSSGDDDRDRNNRRYRPLPERFYVDPDLVKNQKEDDEQETEETDPNVKVVWLYPLDKDGNLIIPEDEVEAQSSTPENLFESRSNTLFSPESRRIFYSSPPNNPTGDSGFTPITDSDTWHTLPLQDIPTVSTYDLDTSFNSLNVSGSSEAAHSTDPHSSTSAMLPASSSRPWRSRNYFLSTPMTSSNLSFSTNSETVVTSATAGANPTGRYVIPQRRVHFQTSNTTTSEVVYNSGTRIDLPPSEPRRSQDQDSNARMNTPQAGTSGDNGGNNREPPHTIFFSDTASTSSDSDTNNTSSNQPRSATIGAPLRRMQVSDSIETPSVSTHTYIDDTDDVWEPLSPVRDSSNSQHSFDYSQFPPPITDSLPTNTDQFWDSNPSDQIDQTESNDTDAFGDVSSMLNQSFEESGIHFNRRQNQHDIAPRVKDDRLVIPLFRLDQDGNLIYDDLDENSDSSESSEESSCPSSIEFFAPMDYNFDPVYSPFPSASSSSLSSDEQGDRPTSHTHGPFGIFPPRTQKKDAGSFGSALQSVPQTGKQIPVLRGTNRVRSLFSMAGAEVGRVPRPTPLVSPISSTTSRGSFIDRGRSSGGLSIPRGSRPGRWGALRGASASHGEDSRTSTSSQPSTSGLSQPSTSFGDRGVLDLQSDEGHRRRVHFTNPFVVANALQVREQQQQQGPEQRYLSQLMPGLDDLSLQDLPPLPDSDSSDESEQSGSFIHSNPGHSAFDSSVPNLSLNSFRTFLDSSDDSSN